MKRRQKIKGCLWGVVLGDALGLPFEGTPRDSLNQLALYIRHRVQRPRPWGYSDDSEMMLVLANTLIERNQFDTLHFLSNLAHQHDPARGYGKGTRRLLEAHQRGTPMHKLPTIVWADGSKGAGGAVRLPALVCWYACHPHHELSSPIHKATACTHAHPDALAASQLFGHTLHWILNHDTTSPSWGWALIHDLKERLPAQHQLLSALSGWIERAFNSEAIVDEFGHGLFALEAVPAAIACILSTSCDFERAVSNAVCLGGDTDTIGALAGALSGACVGFDAIPALWLQNVKHETKLGTIDAFLQELDAPINNAARKEAVRGRRRVLYIEDHQSFARLVRNTWLDGFEVVHAFSLEEAEAIWAAEKPFDLVLVDFDLPDGKGTQWLKNRQKASEMPRAVAVSSHEHGNLSLMEAGAEAMCSKMSIATLGEVIERVLSR